MLAALSVQPTGHTHREDERNSKREEGQSKMFCCFSSRPAACWFWPTSDNSLWSDNQVFCVYSAAIYTSIRSLFFTGKLLSFSCVQFIVQSVPYIYIFIFLTGIVDSCSQNTNMSSGKLTWSAAAGHYTTGSALLILPMVHWACGLLPWLSPPQETEVLIITYRRYSCFHWKTLRPSLVLSLYYPVLPL